MLSFARCFPDAGKWDPTVALRIAALARRKRVRLLHTRGVKGTLAARMAARLTGARTLVHVHDLNDPGVMLGALQGLLARPTDTAVCPERVCVARNGIPEALRQAGAGARSQGRAETAGDEQ